MMTEDAKEYLEEFNPAAYLEQYEKFEGVARQDYIMKHAHTFTKEIAKCVPGGNERYLDYGCGPTIHTAAAFADKVKEIYFTDFTPQNLAQINKWLTCEENAHDWSKILNYYADGRNMTGNQLGNMVRTKSRGTYHGDINADLIIEELEGTFDVITTAFCLEAGCKTKAGYRSGAQKLVDLLNPGGYLMDMLLLDMDEYKVGEKFFHNTNMSKADIIDAWKATGAITLKELHTEIYGEEHKGEPAYFSGIFAILVQKPQI